MALPYSSWVGSNLQQSSIPTRKQPPSKSLFQGPILSVDPCRHLTDAPPYQQQHQHHSPGDSVSPRPETMFTQSPSNPSFDPSSGHYTEMEGSSLDYDILNNLNYLDNLDFGFGYPSDFVLFPAEETFIQDNFTDATLFPDLDDLLPYSSPDVSPPPTHKYQCEYCSESFPRRCELTRHLLKHTTPFKCTQPGCPAAFAEKRRCIQHIKAVHGLATDKDLRKCHLCGYSSIRPDAVKRHLRLKHGSKSESSPSTVSSEQSGEDGGRGKEGRRRR